MTAEDDVKSVTGYELKSAEYHLSTVIPVINTRFLISWIHQALKRRANSLNYFWQRRWEHKIQWNALLSLRIMSLAMVLVMPLGSLRSLFVSLFFKFLQFFDIRFVNHVRLYLLLAFSWYCFVFDYLFFSLMVFLVLFWNYWMIVVFSRSWTPQYNFRVFKNSIWFP